MLAAIKKLPFLTLNKRRMSCVSDLIKITVEAAKVKPAWGIPLLLSFLVLNKVLQEPGLLFGFCVWGSPDTPSTSAGCTNSPANSHILAFGIDLVMTALAALFWQKDKNPKKSTIMYIALLGSIILAHGLLHWVLQQPEFNCYTPDPPAFATTVFGVFSFFLSLIILGFGFPEAKWTVGVSVLFAAAVLALTKGAGAGGELALPGLFVIVHPLSCFTGLFSKGPSFNKTVGSCCWYCGAFSM